MLAEKDCNTVEELGRAHVPPLLTVQSRMQVIFCRYLGTTRHSEAEHCGLGTHDLAPRGHCSSWELPLPSVPSVCVSTPSMGTPDLILGIPNLTETREANDVFLSPSLSPSLPTLCIQI